MILSLLDKLIPLIAISVFFLSVNVNQAMAIGDQFFDVIVDDVNGVAVEGADCTVSDPGMGILKSGVTDADGEYQAELTEDEINGLSGSLVDIQCTKDSASAMETVSVVGNDVTTSISLVLQAVENVIGGEIIPIESTSLLVSGMHTILSWIITAVVLVAGTGAFFLKRK